MSERIGDVANSLDSCFNRGHDGRAWRGFLFILLDQYSNCRSLRYINIAQNSHEGEKDVKRLMLALVLLMLVNVLGSPAQVVFAAGPAKPSLSSPGNGSSWPQSTVIELKWNSSAGATQYKVELWGGPYTTMVPCNWLSGTSCWIGTMWPGTMYWHVKARNADGESDWSDTWSFIIQDNGNPPPDGNPPPGGESCSNLSDLVSIQPINRAFRFPYAHTAGGRTAIEYAVGVQGSKCSALVNIIVGNASAQGPGIEFELPYGELTFDSKFEPESSSYSIHRGGPYTTSGISDAEHTAEPAFFSGSKVESTVDGGNLFQLGINSEIRYVFIPERETSYNYNPVYNYNYNFSVSPEMQNIVQVTVYAGILTAAGIATIVAASTLTPAYAAAMVIIIVGSWFTQQTGRPLGAQAMLPSSTSQYAQTMVDVRQIEFNLLNISYRISPSSDSASVMHIPSNDVLQAMRQSYGPLVDSATLGSLTPTRTHVSAYTSFGYQGDGFTPNSEVYVSFGLPGQPSLFAQVVKSNQSGHIDGGFEMPAPEQVELGNYILVATDYATLNNSPYAVS